MRSASLGLQPASSNDTAYRPETGPVPSGYAALTLAAMSLGYGVVQLDVPPATGSNDFATPDQSRR